jgi:hypothetical protein
MLASNDGTRNSYTSFTIDALASPDFDSERSLDGRIGRHGELPAVARARAIPVAAAAVAAAVVATQAGAGG